MTIALPLLPKAAQVTPRLMDFGATLRPPLGGAVQRVNRLGARFAVEVQLPPLSLADARAFLARQAKAKTTGDTLKLAWPQADGGALSVGTPLVNGAGQTGATLAADGFTSGVVIPEGAFFSFVVGGRTYLHMTTGAVTATGGAATLPIAPMLRATPTDNLALNFAAPEIEGFLADGDLAWEIMALRAHGLAFGLAEAR